MIIEQAVPQPEIDRALESLSALQWKMGVAQSDEYSREIKRNQELRRNDDHRNPNDPLHLRHILTGLEKNIFSNLRFSQSVYPLKGAALRFNRCTNGGFYGPHADSSLMNRPPIRSDVSVTLWLTDDYEGGELCIHGMGEFKGKPGDIVVYPSHYVHEVKPVTRGERICAVMWVQSMIREESQRELLRRFYELGVRTKEKENLSPDYIEMVSLYNNLLRQWADV